MQRKLLALYYNTWDHLTESKQMSFCSVKKIATHKLFVYITFVIDAYV